MKKLAFPKFVTFLLIVAGTVCSCKDDEGDSNDKIDCDAIESQLVDLEGALNVAITNNACEDIEEISVETISLLQECENCVFIQKKISDGGFEDIDEYIEDLEDFLAEALIDCDSAQQLITDIAAIEEYLEINNITAQSDPSGLTYVVTAAGSGVNPTLESEITLTYTLKLLSTGEVIDHQPNATTYTLSNLILGLQIGLQLLQEGTQATLFIPSGLAYGPNGMSIIPPNAVLIFELELIDVN